MSNANDLKKPEQNKKRKTPDESMPKEGVNLANINPTGSAAKKAKREYSLSDKLNNINTMMVRALDWLEEIEKKKADYNPELAQEYREAIKAILSIRIPVVQARLQSIRVSIEALNQAEHERWVTSSLALNYVKLVLGQRKMELPAVTSIAEPTLQDLQSILMTDPAKANAQKLAFIQAALTNRAPRNNETLAKLAQLKERLQKMETRVALVSGWLKVQTSTHTKVAFEPTTATMGGLYEVPIDKEQSPLELAENMFVLMQTSANNFDLAKHNLKNSQLPPEERSRLQNRLIKLRADINAYHGEINAHLESVTDPKLRDKVKELRGNVGTLSQNVNASPVEKAKDYLSKMKDFCEGIQNASVVMASGFGLDFLSSIEPTVINNQLGLKGRYDDIVIELGNSNSPSILVPNTEEVQNLRKEAKQKYEEFTKLAAQLLKNIEMTKVVNASSRSGLDPRLLAQQSEARGSSSSSNRESSSHSASSSQYGSSSSNR